MSICKSVVLVLHLFTAHNEADYMNDRTIGAGVECRQESTSVAVGTFENSFYKQSVYAVAGYDPIVTKHFTLGIVGGVASGYGDYMEYPVLAGVRARIMVGPIELGAMGIPGVAGGTEELHLTLGWRF